VDRGASIEKLAGLLSADEYGNVVSKGVLGKIKACPGYYFTTPVEAVMECLKRRGEGADRCSPAGIADDAGVPGVGLMVASIGLLAAYLRRI